MQLRPVTRLPPRPRLVRFSGTRCPRCGDAGLYFCRYEHHEEKLLQRLVCGGCHYTGLYEVSGNADK